MLKGPSPPCLKKEPNLNLHPDHRTTVSYTVLDDLENSTKKHELRLGDSCFIVD